MKSLTYYYIFINLIFLTSFNWNTNNTIPFSSVNTISSVNPIDSDNDGVVDSLDICNGFNDTIDINSNGIPDGCDPVFCINTLNLAANGEAGGIYQAILLIQSSSTINLNSNTSVHYYIESGSIDLTSGFTATGEVSFTAEIEPCCSDSPAVDYAWLNYYVTTSYYAVSQCDYANGCIFKMVENYFPSGTTYRDRFGNFICYQDYFSYQYPPYGCEIQTGNCTPVP